MKVKKLNKIAVIQWDNNIVRIDLGDQKINLNEIIKVLEICKINMMRDYQDEQDSNID